MAKAGVLSGASRSRFLGLPDPFKPVWRLLTSVRFALALIAFLVVCGLAGTLIPQIPIPMRGNPVAEQAWVSFQQERFGLLSDPLYRLGIFNIFEAPWFTAGLGLLVVTVTVCTVSRFPPTWRTVTRPPETVPDTFFDRAGRRVSFDLPSTPDGIEQALRRRRYSVKRFPQDNVTFLFADRYPWAQLGTFVSHLSLILLLAGALVSSLATVEEQHLIAEGETAGVFSPADDRHFQLHVNDFIARFDEMGRPLDFRSFLTVIQNGQVAMRGESTVNEPMQFNGFRFHQSTYTTDGAALTVRDRSTGNIVYRETIRLTSGVPAPTVTITDAGGAVLFSGLLIPTDHIATQGSLVWGRTVQSPVEPDTRLFLGTYAPNGAAENEQAQPWELIILELGPAGLGTPQRIRPGDAASAGGVQISLDRIAQIPAIETSDIPGAGDNAILELDYDEGSAGRLVLLTGDGPPLEMAAGETRTLGDYDYTFEGQRDFTGITVRRDPGTGLVWVAVGLMLIGLGITFYLPRRRLWIRLAPDRVTFAGLPGIMVNFPREMAQLAAEAGSREARSALQERDRDEEGAA
jgi:cytochrome c biogenesis protein ResB